MSIYTSILKRQGGRHLLKDMSAKMDVSKTTRLVVGRPMLCTKYRPRSFGHAFATSSTWCIMLPLDVACDLCDHRPATLASALKLLHVQADVGSSCNRKVSIPSDSLKKKSTGVD